MRRREFIRLLGGALATQAIPANAQEPVRMRTVGVLMGFANDVEAKARVEVFEQGLETEGWSLGQNLRIEYRYAEGDSARMQAFAKELVELNPGCIVGHSTPVVTALMHATRTIPHRLRVSFRSDRRRIRRQHETGSGVALVPDNFTTVHRELIISLTARFRIPTIYPYRYFAEAGGLMSYGADAVDLFRGASGYVSRILRGTKPADLPVQAPSKFELVINHGTAKALGLMIPRVLLVGADQVIE